MKIREAHMYHGSALTQIAEHPRFTAINGFRIGSSLSRCAFRINDDIGVYLKYASKSFGKFKEYLFTFNADHLDELRRLHRRCGQTCVALICVKDREICCITYDLLQQMISERRRNARRDEDQYGVLVTAKKGHKFRVYMNSPGTKGEALSIHVISRSEFPGILFK